MNTLASQNSKPALYAGIAVCAGAVSLYLLAWMPSVILALLIALFAVLMAYKRAILQSSPFALPLWFLLVLIGLAIGLYQPEGFAYPLVFQSDALHPRGHPFTLQFDGGKTLAGYLILIALLPLAFKSPKTLAAPGLQILLVTLLSVGIIAFATFLLDLEFYLKSLSTIVIFGLINLLCTCIAEEAFMRLALQNEIQRAVGRYTRNPILREYGPLVFTTLIFLHTHSSTSAEISLLYAIAGFLYGLVYTLSKNILCSIGLHFLVNILHFSFLTYPISA